MVVREGGDISYRDMQESDNLDSPIRDFYEGSVIFVTGATGFMGKVLIEKLLRCCPRIPKMYILARSKKGKDIGERFKEQFEDPLYERLKREQPNFLSKLNFVSGDVGSLNLGLSDDDFLKITTEVNVIFHGAATVRFDERLQRAVLVNVRGTREALCLARKCVKLAAFLHISTAFSYCVSKDIEEKFYEPPIPAEKLITLVDTLDEEACHKITPILLGEFPNTYAFTKMVAEDAVKKLSSGLPVAMIRPAIIIATSKEPVQGWIDNVYGPTGVILGAAVGLLRSLHCDSKNLAEIIPVDYVINATIAAAYEIGHAHNTPNKEELPKEGGWEDFGPKAVEKDIPIYNYVSSNERPITWGLFMKLSEKHGMDIPTTYCIWYYCFSLNKFKWIHMLYIFFLHYLPAYLVDGVLYCIGKKPMLIDAYKKVHKFSSVISYFSTQQWRFHNKNTQDLAKNLAPGDKILFDSDISHLDWEEYFFTYMRGLRLYLMKESFDTLEKARRKYTYLKMAHYTITTIFGMTIAWVCWSILQYFGIF